MITIQYNVQRLNVTYEACQNIEITYRGRHTWANDYLGRLPHLI